MKGLYTDDEQEHAIIREEDDFILYVGKSNKWYPIEYLPSDWDNSYKDYRYIYEYKHRLPLEMIQNMELTNEST